MIFGIELTSENIFLIGCSIYNVFCLISIVKGLIKIKEQRKEYKVMLEAYKIKTDLYFANRDAAVDRLLAETSAMQLQLDRVKKCYSYYSKEEQESIDSVQTQLNQFRAEVITSFHIINL